MTRAIVLGFSAGVFALACSSSSADGGSALNSAAGGGATGVGATVLDGGAEATAPALGLSDAAPTCGAANAACCPAGQKPVPWSHEGERCIPGFTCEGDICRLAEVGAACTKDADCPLSGHCVSVGAREDGGASSVCTSTCGSAADCTPGWSCQASPERTDLVCACTKRAETCNGKDDDCDGVVDGQAGNADCASKLHASAAACCGEGTCIDLATDPKNFGACGHDCLGGTCKDGACAPLPVAAGSDFSTEPIGAAKGHVFFGSTGSCGNGMLKSQLLHCSSVPCPTPDVLDDTACVSSFATLGFFSAVVADPTTPGRVFYSRAATLDGTLGALFVSGGGASKQQISPAGGGLSGPRIDAMAFDQGDAATPARLWWGDASGNVRSCAANSCVATVATLFTAPGPIGAIAVDGTDVFASTIAAGSHLGNIVSCPKSGCVGGQQRVIAQGELNVKSIAATRGNLFWASAGTPPAYEDGVIRACATNAVGCTPRSIGPVKAPLGLAADARFLYFASFSVGIRRCAVDACTTLETIAPRVNPAASLDGLAQDETALYFYDGALQRLAK